MRYSKMILCHIVIGALILTGLASSAPAATQDEAVYLRVMHAASGILDVEVFINDEPLLQPRVFGYSHLWSLSDTFTATLALPAPGMAVDTLPMGGASGYEELPAGDYRVAFARPGDGAAQAVARLEAALAPGRYTAVLVDSAGGGFQVRLLADTLDSADGAGGLYHIVNSLAEEIEVVIDDAGAFSIAGDGLWSRQYTSGEAGHIRIVAGDMTLYDETAPSKAFLPDVVYTLAVIRLEGESGVMIHATTVRGITGITAGGDDLAPGTTRAGEIAGRGGDGRGYVEQTYFLRLEENAQVNLTVIPAPDSLLDPYLRIIDVMTGALIAWNDDLPPDGSTLAAGVTDVWLAAGTYAISVSGYAYGTAGEYLLTVSD